VTCEILEFFFIYLDLVWMFFFFNLFGPFLDPHSNINKKQIKQ
jgi:hypothetical protein